MSANVGSCEYCGWQDASLLREPKECARCLGIKQMFLAGVSRREIARKVGICYDDLSETIRRLRIKHPPLNVETCPVCGWRGVTARHKPSVCACNVQVKNLCTSGMSRRETAQGLGISYAALCRAMYRLGIKRPPPKVEICPACGWQGVIARHKKRDCAPMQTSADVATCEFCGWKDAGLLGKPNDCARCLRITQMFLAGVPRLEITRELGISYDRLSDAIRGLGIKRPPHKVEICPACGWRGVIAFHKPHHCAHFSQVRKARMAGMSRREIERELGISDGALSHVIHRLRIEHAREC